MYTLKGTVLIQSSLNFVRLLIVIISRSGLKLCHVRLKTRALDQILEKLCVPSRGHSFDHKFMKLCQNVNHYYAPNFGEVEGAYWFGPVHPSVCLYVHLSIRPSVRNSLAAEKLENR